MKYTIIFILFTSIISAQKIDDNGNEVIQTIWKLDTDFNRAKYANDANVTLFGLSEWQDDVQKDERGRAISIVNGVRNGRIAPTIPTGRALGGCWDVNEGEAITLSGSYTFSDCTDNGRVDNNGDTFDLLFEFEEPNIKGTGITYAGNIITIDNAGWSFTIDGEFTLIKVGGIYADLIIERNQ
jgi:hypothetical protein